jgi:hypothetical protein
VTVLVCAATRTELGACARGIRASGVPAPAFETLATGVGLARAAQSLEERLARAERPSLIVSSGFAGVLGGGISVGTWVTAARVAESRGGERIEIPDVTLREAPAPAVRCDFVSSAGVLQSESKPDGGGLIVAVDMESAAIARQASQRDIAVMVLRFVSDTPEQPLPGFVSPLAASMASMTLRGAVAHAARGVKSALGDPRGAARFVRDGRAWARELAEGWMHFARAIAGALL